VEIYDPNLGGDPMVAVAWKATERYAVLATPPLALGVLAIRCARGRRPPNGNEPPRRR
jgi:hypothetical protein